MGEQTSVAIKEAAAVKPKSPILNELEKLVYERCVETGETSEDALADDPALHVKIVRALEEKVRVPRVQQKLEENADWWKKREELRKTHPARV